MVPVVRTTAEYYQNSVRGATVPQTPYSEQIAGRHAIPDVAAQVAEREASVREARRVKDNPPPLTAEEAAEANERRKSYGPASREEAGLGVIPVRIVHDGGAVAVSEAE